MTFPDWVPLHRHGPSFDLPREEGGGHSDVGGRTGHGDGPPDRNAVTAAEAVRLVRSIRAEALRQPLPDSTPLIRIDRDGR